MHTGHNSIPEFVEFLEAIQHLLMAIAPPLMLFRGLSTFSHLSQSTIEPHVYVPFASKSSTIKNSHLCAGGKENNLSTINSRKNKFSYVRKYRKENTKREAEYNQFGSGFTFYYSSERLFTACIIWLINVGTFVLCRVKLVFQSSLSLIKSN